MKDGDDQRWVVATRRRAALRVLAAGVVIAALGVAYVLVHRGELGDDAAIEASVVGASGAIVGGALILAGIVMLRRVRAPVTVRDDVHSGKS